MPATEHVAGLRRIEGRIGTAKPVFVHVLAGDDIWVWCDTGIATTPDEVLIDSLPWQEVHRHVAVISHADVDHFGGLGRLRGAIPRLLVAAHRADARWIADRDAVLHERYLAHEAEGVSVPTDRQAQLRARGGEVVRPDVQLRGGETFDLGPGGRWEVIALPGHSPGSIGLWNVAERTAIVGDAVLGWGVVDGNGRLAPPPYVSVADYLATIERLERLRPARLLLSHEPELVGADAAAALAASRTAVAEIGRAVISSRRHGVSSLGDLCLRVARDIDRWPDENAFGLADAVAAHLRHEGGR